MTKFFSSNISVLSEGNKNDLEDTEADISWLPEEVISFGGEQYFNEIKRMRPKGIVKFKPPRIGGRDY